MDVSGDSAEAVIAARAGDCHAYGHLVECYWNEAVRLARSVAGDGDAEDVAQDALVRAWRSLGQLSSPDRFRPWLMRIVYRCGLRQTRWRRLRVALGARVDPICETDPSAEIDLHRLLSRLPPRQRAVLHLTVVDEMTDSEIGEVLSLSPGSVRAHRRRARESLSRILEPETP